jgi:hypothetical protein
LRIVAVSSVTIAARSAIARCVGIPHLCVMSPWFCPFFRMFQLCCEQLFVSLSA